MSAFFRPLLVRLCALSCLAATASLWAQESPVLPILSAEPALESGVPSVPGTPVVNPATPVSALPGAVVDGSLPVVVGDMPVILELAPLVLTANLREAAVKWQAVIDQNLNNQMMLDQALADPALANQAKALNVRAPVLTYRKELALGSKGESVRLLVGALRHHQYWTEVDDPDVFDERVEAAVKWAQANWGFVEDGKAGAHFYSMLNADPSEMVILLNRWADEIDEAARVAWAAGDRKMVVVNIPSATLRALDLTTGLTVVESKAIVGLPHRKTPRYTTRILSLRYNPSWYPPASLIKIGRHYMPPGPNNPLGVLAFITDNDEKVYLHDTNEHDLFDQQNRARSSGCVRVQEWKSLAVFVSDFEETYIDEAIAAKKTKTEAITSLPVVITYSLVDLFSGAGVRYPDVYRLGSQIP